MMYYNRSGDPLTMWEWAALHRDWSYRRIAKTEYPTDSWVSTVWLGLDYGFGGRPLIFETMVFVEQGGAGDDYMERYSTEEEALEGHKRACAWVEERLAVIEALIADPRGIPRGPEEGV